MRFAQTTKLVASEQIEHRWLHVLVELARGTMLWVEHIHIELLLPALDCVTILNLVHHLNLTIPRGRVIDRDLQRIAFDGNISQDQDPRKVLRKTIDHLGFSTNSLGHVQKLID